VPFTIVGSVDQLPGSKSSIIPHNFCDFYIWHATRI
jgi:hypothetical protein